MYASQPAVWLRSSSAFIARALNAMIGMDAVAGSCFRIAVAARPSIPGS
jgi:hypothetical protein